MSGLKYIVMGLLIGGLMGCATTHKSLTPACSERQVSCQEKIKINPW